MRSGATMDQSQSTLYSMSTYLSGSTDSGRTRTMESSDSNNNVNDNDDEHDDDSSSEFSFNECDITLIDDDDILCDAKTDGELLYCQVVEMLRFEVEVCVPTMRFSASILFGMLWEGFLMCGDGECVCGCECSIKVFEPNVKPVLQRSHVITITVDSAIYHTNSFAKCAWTNHPCHILI